MRCPFSTHFVSQNIRNIGLDWKALICTASIIWFLTTFPVFPGNTIYLQKPHWFTVDNFVRAKNVAAKDSRRTKWVDNGGKGKEGDGKDQRSCWEIEVRLDRCNLENYFPNLHRCFCLSRGSTGILGLGRMFRRYCCTPSYGLFCIVFTTSFIWYILSMDVF